MSYLWHIIGERIRNNRIELKMTQEQFSEAIATKIGHPLKRQTVAGWENGSPVKKLEQLVAMCELFQCDMSYLLCECSTKRAASQTVASTLGISEASVDILITAAKDKNPLLSVLSDLIEDSRNQSNELATGHNVLSSLAFASSLDLGPGCVAHDAIFHDCLSDQEMHFYVTPRDIYLNSLRNIHKATDSFIKKLRTKYNLPDYE